LRAEIQHFGNYVSNQWIVHDFYPIDYIPRGVRLTSYDGDATDLPAQVLQEYLDRVSVGEAVVPIDRIYSFDQIVEAHRPWKPAVRKGSW
jgi:NADPH:quinone reductase